MVVMVESFYIELISTISDILLS